MATAHLISSSSPPRQIQNESCDIAASSSPDLPPINQITSKYLKKPPLRSRSNSGQISPNATTSGVGGTSLVGAAEDNSFDILEVFHPSSVLSGENKKGPQGPSEDVLVSTHANACEPELPVPKRRARAHVRSRKGHQTKKSNSLSTDIEILGDVINTGDAPDVASGDENRPVQKVLESIEETEATADLPQAKVKKPRGKLAGTSKTSKGESVSRYFAPPLPNEPQAPARTATSVIVAEEQPINLEPAVARRSDWTPSREIEAGDPGSASSDIEEISSSLHGGVLVPASNVFETLQHTFSCPTVSCQNRSNSPDKKLAPALEVIKKRKAKQLVGPPNNTVPSEETSPTKPKAPKKKPRTLTELATAAYVGDSLEDSGARAQSGSLVKYLDGGQEPQTLQHGHPASRLRKPDRKGRSKGRRQVLLSPLSAIDQSARQDFVFGTSSQLAQEHSPTFLRDLQAALKQSNELIDDSFANSTPEPTKEQRKLWAVGARGEDESLVDIEVISLLDSPAFPEDPMAAVRAGMQNSHSKRPKAAIDDGEEGSIISLGSDGMAAPQVAVSETQVLSTAIFELDGQAVSTVGLESDAVGAQDGIDDNEPPPSNQEVYQSLPAQKQKEPSVPRPKYEVMTDAQLSKQISKYGFKMVKKRSAMIALLEQCWASKSGVSTGGSQTNIATMATTSPVSDTSAKTKLAAATAKTPTKKTRGRPRKDNNNNNNNSTAEAVLAPDADHPAKRGRGRPKKTAGSLDANAPRVEKAAASKASPRVVKSQTPQGRRKTPAKAAFEISDSEADDGLSHSPSPSPERVFSSPEREEFDVSIGQDAEMSLAACPTDQQAELFSYITQAVKTAPRATNPAMPSWHEKMLMYDPIVLEDLAAWLNAGQLDRVGYDGEVAPTEVKSWCESKSVCCLWRMSYRGRERKRL